MFRSNLRLLHQQAGILNLHGVGEVAFSIDDLDDLGHIEAGANGSVSRGIRIDAFVTIFETFFKIKNGKFKKNLLNYRYVKWHIAHPAN
jgi:hypothetical protein